MISRSINALLRETKCNALALQSFFDSSLDTRHDVQWLFILTFPNGGSTALAKLLLTAPGTAAVADNAEGQWLIPSLSKAGARWRSQLRISERKIRAVWLSRVKRYHQGPLLVIEKSPPNMCRHDTLLRAFKAMHTYTITFSRDPYATCASWHRRYGAKTVVWDWRPDSAHRITSEKDYFELLGDIWIERAMMLLAARKVSIMNIRYEDFTEDTHAVLNRLSGVIPQLRGASATAKVKVKDYAAQEIVNMNEKQIGTLSNDQIEALSNSLRRNAEVVERLGYSIR